jgi:hypothetical protein
MSTLEQFKNEHRSRFIEAKRQANPELIKQQENVLTVGALALFALGSSLILNVVGDSGAQFSDMLSFVAGVVLTAGSFVCLHAFSKVSEKARRRYKEAKAAYSPFREQGGLV